MQRIVTVGLLVPSQRVRSGIKARKMMEQGVTSDKELHGIDSGGLM